MSSPSTNTEGTPPAGRQAPQSVETVKKPQPPSKPPALVAVEKKVAALEDDLSGFKGWQAEVNSLLEGLGVGGPVPIRKGKSNAASATPAPARGFIDDVNETLFGAS